MSQIILDIATAPIEGAETFLEGSVSAPSNYKDPAKIADYLAEKQAERVAGAAFDLDLARITGLGVMTTDGITVAVCKTEEDEKQALMGLTMVLAFDPHRVCQIITYNGLYFDLPILMRRARYLGVKFPALNLDRYRSPHADLCAILSDNNTDRRRSLAFYIKRLGWTDLVKPLSGEEESKVHETGHWDALAASIRHDLAATYRLALWLGLVSPASEDVLL